MPRLKSKSLWKEKEEFWGEGKKGGKVGPYQAKACDVRGDRATPGRRRVLWTWGMFWFINGKVAEEGSKSEEYKKDPKEGGGKGVRLFKEASWDLIK